MEAQALTASTDRQPRPEWWSELERSLELFNPPTRIAEVLGLTNGAQGVYELARPRSPDPLPTLKVGKYLRIPKHEFLLWLTRRCSR
jgi:hypothetical protein